MKSADNLFDKHRVRRAADIGRGHDGIVSGAVPG